jgi:hypothetical protein
VGTVGAVGTSSDDFYLIDRRGNITRLTTSQSPSIGQGSINDHDQVAFVFQGDAIFFDGTTFHNVTNGALTVEPAGLLGRALNNRGQLAFGTGVQLIFPVGGDGTNLVDVTAGTGITCCGNSPALGFRWTLHWRP